MKTSLYKIFTEFEKFASSHKMLQSFSVEPITEYVANNWIYPLMWIDLQETTMAFSTGLATFTFPVYILDRVEREYSNYKSVSSSTQLTLRDFYVYYNDRECDFGFVFSNSSNLTSRAYEFDDIVCGWSSNIVCQVAEDYDEDQIPIS